MSENLRYKLARAINGPHGPTHIGAEKLDELQRHRWNTMTNRSKRRYALQRADVVIETLFAEAMALFTKDETPLPGCVVLHRLEKLRGKSDG